MVALLREDSHPSDFVASKSFSSLVLEDFRLVSSIVMTSPAQLKIWIEVSPTSEL